MNKFKIAVEQWKIPKEKLQDIISAYNKVENKHKEAIKDGKISKYELEEIKKSVEKMTNKNEVVEQENNDNIKKIIKEGRREIYVDKFLARKTNWEKLAKYFEYMTQDEKEMNLFLKTLEKDQKLLFDFMIYWSSEKWYRRYEWKIIDKMFNFSWHHVLTILKKNEKYGVAEKINNIYRKYYENFKKEWIDEKYYIYQSWTVRWNQWKKDFQEFREEKFNKENANFNITYDLSKELTWKKCYNIDSRVYEWFEQFVKDPNSSLSKLSNKQIARYFSFIYLCEKSVANKPFSNKINWWNKEPSDIEKTNIVQKFQEKLSNDADGIVKLSHNWWNIKDEKEEKTIDQLLQTGDAKWVKKLALSKAREWIFKWLSNHLNNFIKLNSPWIDNQKIKNTTEEILKIVNKCDSNKEFKKLFFNIKNILDKNWIKINEINEADLFKKILQSKATDILLKSHENLTDPKDKKLEATAKITIAEYTLSQTNQFSNPEKHKELAKELGQVKKDSYKFLWKKNVKWASDFAKSTFWMMLYLSSANDNNSKIEVARTARNFYKMDDNISEKFLNQQKVLKDSKEFLYNPENSVSFLSLANNIIWTNIRTIKELYSNPILRNKVIERLELKWDKLTKDEKSLLDIFKKSRQANIETKTIYLTKIEWVSEDVVKKALSKPDWELYLEKIADKVLNSEYKKTSQSELQNIIDSWIDYKISKNENIFDSKWTISTKKLDEYFSQTKENHIFYNGIEIKKWDNKWEFLIAWEKCKKWEELENVLDSISFFKNSWLGIFAQNIQELTQSINQSNLKTKSQIEFNFKDWLSTLEQNKIISWIWKILFQDAKNLKQEDIIEKIKNLPTSWEKSLDNILRNKWIIKIWTTEIDYNKLEKSLA